MPCFPKQLNVWLFYKQLNLNLEQDNWGLILYNSHKSLVNVEIISKRLPECSQSTLVVIRMLTIHASKYVLLQFQGSFFLTVALNLGFPK